MPEGDSLFKLASKLAPVLKGREVLSFTARRIADDTARTLVGHRIVLVEARGKNLLVGFDDGRALHIHLKMHGRVFVERPRSTFYSPTRSVPEMRLAVPGAAIVGRNLPVCRILSPMQTRAAPDLAGLGPDLARAGFDEDEAVRRLRGLTRRTIGEALLVQRAAAGIGNVYKSEVLFLESVDPRRFVASIDDETLRLLLRRASVLLRRNLVSGPRTTRPNVGGGRLWVYGRGGRPCYRCEGSITRFMQGPEGGRSTYFCETCQATPS